MDKERYATDVSNCGDQLNDCLQVERAKYLGNVGQRC